MRNARIQRVDCMTTRFSRVTLALGTTDVLSRTSLCSVGLSCVLVGNIAGLHPLSDSSTPLPRKLWQPKMCPDIAKCLLGAKLPKLRTTGLVEGPGRECGGWGQGGELGLLRSYKVQGRGINSRLPWVVDEILFIFMKGATGDCWITISQRQILLFYREYSLTTKWKIYTFSSAL